MKKQIVIFTLLLISGIFVYAQKFEGLAETPPKLAETPPMGWNSWNYFECDGINENVIMEIADAMVENGMKDAGYEYVVIDDCWQVGRENDGTIIVDKEKFPNGIKALAGYVHSKGLKFGIYSDAGTATCQGRPGSRGYEFQDARTYAEWGVDYLKYDWCNTTNQNAQASYTIMRDALYQAGRPMVFSICEWGESKPWTWAQDVGHLWRTTTDIQDCWDCEVNWGGLGWIKILDKQDGLEEYAGPGHWNDPDMLEVGNGGLTTIEGRAHFSLWCMLAAPLMAGNDIRNMTDETKAILTNPQAIAINQDELGKQGFRVLKFDNIDVWVKPLSNNEFAVCFLNRCDEPYELNFDWGKFYVVDKTERWKGIPLNENFNITHVWDNKAMGNTKEVLNHKLKGHDVLFVKLSK